MKTMLCNIEPLKIATEEEYSNCTAGTFSGMPITLWPYGNEREAISPRDMAKHLSKVIYFPESPQSPFSAAQYAVELADSLRSACSHLRLYALLRNAHEAYLGHVPPAVRAAEKLMANQMFNVDGRDALEATFSALIFKALDLKTTQEALESGQISIEDLAAIDHAKQRLDATLERDLGIYIHRQDSTVTTIPLPRKITPWRWDYASEEYLRTYQRLILASREAISVRQRDI